MIDFKKCTVKTWNWLYHVAPNWRTVWTDKLTRMGKEICRVKLELLPLYCPGVTEEHDRCYLFDEFDTQIFMWETRNEGFSLETHTWTCMTYVLHILFSCRIALEEQSFSRLSFYCKAWYYRPVEDYYLQECDVVWFVNRCGRQQFAPKPRHLWTKLHGVTLQTAAAVTLNILRTCYLWAHCLSFLITFEGIDVFHKIGKNIMLP